MKSILVHAWTLHKKENKYYIPYTHWVYLQEIVKYYDKVCLLSPVNKSLQDESQYESVSVFENVEVHELPFSEGYIDAIKYFFTYKKAYKELAPQYDEVYARYPIPFGWLQQKYFRNKKKIIHFVGDPIDTIINNPNLSFLKKKLYTTFFKPENYMFTKACKQASVYTNGYHIAERLNKKGIQATPLVSSTLNKDDFYFNNDKIINTEAPKIIYVGYLRKAKGVETVVNSFALLQREKPNASLTIVGHGESEELLKNIVKEQNIFNVLFTGHVDNREKLNELLRSHDIFCFASLSEGSPRVILEAMANGLAVVSTPVGSLPHTFVDKEDILFANFNDSEDFKNKLLTISSNKAHYDKIRKNSFKKVATFTIDNFIKKIFYEA
ncbi:glycosyltransferase family 4 protein [Tenacibaculum sp. A30]|uniref:glycosyltransferase family 4 protein n=1 Tax=Tenacibaculum sp. A30 TaxID=3442644 RepID=UPI003EBA4FB1